MLRLLQVRSDEAHTESRFELLEAMADGWIVDFGKSELRLAAVSQPYSKIRAK